MQFQLVENVTILTYRQKVSILQFDFLRKTTLLCDFLRDTILPFGFLQDTTLPFNFFAGQHFDFESLHEILLQFHILLFNNFAI